MEPKTLPPPKGITIAQACRMLNYSKETIRQMIINGELVAWRPRKNGRRWLIDEVSLAHYQYAAIQTARADAGYNLP